MTQFETIDIVIIIAYFTFVLLVGLYFRKKSSSSMQSFILGGKNLPWYLAGISMVATTFAADTPLYVTEVIATDGVSGNWAWWHFMIGGLLTTFLFAKLWKRAGVLTEAEFLKLRYSGKEAKVLRVFKSIYLGLIINVAIMGWVNLAMVDILMVLFELTKTDAMFWVGGIMLIVILYSSLSGLLGVVYTDFVQFIIAFGGCIVLAVIVLQSSEIGGMSGLKTQLPEGSLNMLPSFGETIGNTWYMPFVSFLAYTGIMWWSSWYPGAEPGGGGYIAQRMMSTKSEKDAQKSIFLFQVLNYCIRPWPWIIVGLCCIVLYPELGDNEKGLGFVMAMNDFLPGGLKGLLLVAFLGAYMSTISTQLNWGVGLLVNDALVPLSNKDMEEKKQVNYSKLLTVVLGLLSLLLVNYMTTIKAVWDFVMQCGAGLGFVLIARWLYWRVNAWTEIVATIVPFVVYALNTLWLSSIYPTLGKPVFEDPSGFFLTVGVTVLASIITMKFTKPTDEDILIEFTDRVKPVGVWGKFGREGANKELSANILKWLFAVIMSYSLLFVIADILFLNWGAIFPKLLILLASSSVFVYLQRKNA